MRATPLLAAVAAGLVSVTAVAAQETPGQSAPATLPLAPTPTLIVTAPDSEEGAKPPLAAPSGAVVQRDPVSAGPATASVATTRKPEPPSLVVKINLETQRLHLHYEGREQAAWPISSGRFGYATPRGVFRPQWASKMWFSRKYDNAPMPHAVFFNGGVAVHGTQSIGLLGQPASHGCVRLAPGNAARFYSLVHKHGFTRTRIEVFGTPPPPRIARRVAPVVGRSGLPARAASNAFPSSRPEAAWLPPTQRPRLVAAKPNGLVYLPPGSPYAGRSSFVHNGVTYVRVR